MLYYLQKFIETVKTKRTSEYLKNGINLFILPFFDWIELKINGQNEYSLKNLNDSLKHKEQSQDNISDNDVLRIIESYLKEKKDQCYQSESYQIGGVWEKILIDAHQELKAELERKNIKRVKSTLSNFGRDKISLGLSLSGGLPHTFLAKIRLVNWMNRTNYAWGKMTKLPENILEYPKEVGNLFGVEVNGKLIIPPAHRLSYFAQRISNLIGEEQHPVIVEIGGGFGGIPYHIFRHFNTKCTYIGFDIPEISVIAKYFLKSIFPDKKFLFHGESKIEKVNLEEYDIILMPNYEIKNLPNKCSDLVFNSHSLVEMDNSTVKEYLVQINRICKKYFLHANHTSSKYKTSKGKVKITVDLSQPQFELPKKDFKRIYRFPEVLTNIGQYNFENYSYYEYLYERRRLK